MPLSGISKSVSIFKEHFAVELSTRPSIDLGLAEVVASTVQTVTGSDESRLTGSLEARSRDFNDRGDGCIDRGARA